MTRIRVADYIAQLLVAAGVEDVFMLTGGGSMHLNDAFGRASGLRPLFLHHEQGCAIAAESYGRLSGLLAAFNVTTGPGGVNALNGVYGAYVDSVGMIVILSVRFWTASETVMKIGAQRGERDIAERDSSTSAHGKRRRAPP